MAFEQTIPGFGQEPTFTPRSNQGVPSPPSALETEDVKLEQKEFQQMARDAGEAFQGLVLAQGNALRQGTPPGAFFGVLEKEFIETARVWKDALKAAGKDTSVADRSLAKALDRMPKVSITQIRTKPGENVGFFQGTERVVDTSNPPLPIVVPGGGTLAEARTGRVLTRGQPKTGKSFRALTTAEKKRLGIPESAFARDRLAESSVGAPDGSLMILAPPQMLGVAA